MDRRSVPTSSRSSVAENPSAAGFSLLAFSFIYGVLHALGPGHGKIVITTWLATHPAKLKSSIMLTLAASLLQGVVAIALVVVVLTLLQLPARQLHLSSFWLEKGSYLLVGALGLLLCWRDRLGLSVAALSAHAPTHSSAARVDTSASTVKVTTAPPLATATLATVDQPRA